MLQQQHTSMLMLSMLNCCLHADPQQGWLSRSTALIGILCNFICCICKLASSCHFHFTHTMASVRGIPKSSTAGFCPGTIRLNGCLLSCYFACKQSSILQTGIHQPCRCQPGLHDAALMDFMQIAEMPPRWHPVMHSDLGNNIAAVLKQSLVNCADWNC